MSCLACRGCGRVVAADAASPYRCAAAGSDDADHVLVRTLAPGASFPSNGESNPFVRFRELTHAHALASSRGMGDDHFVTLVRRLDGAVAAVWGRGFAATPFERCARLSRDLGFAPSGGVWVKNETGNVSGSHKARHLMGLAILGEVQRHLGVTFDRSAHLSIASCGNAALAAAFVARAWGRELDVFIPTGANARVVAELERLGSAVHVCRREPAQAGDPCYVAFRAAVAAGAVPFCCQGTDNGLTIEGGETLAWEIIADVAARGRPLDRLFVQVGGGALASACVQAFEDAQLAGVPVALPRLHPVQTRGAFPLRRAWDRLTERMVRRLVASGGDNGDDARRAEILRAQSSAPVVAGELAYAAAHRSQFMWPWETEPRSIAHGILDDETYDWYAVVRGTIESGGFPVVVDEARLAEANAVGRETTGIDVDATGSAGLAGLIELRRAGIVGSDETVCVLFTGVQR